MAFIYVPSSFLISTQYYAIENEKNDLKKKERRFWKVVTAKKNENNCMTSNWLIKRSSINFSDPFLLCFLVIAACHLPVHLGEQISRKHKRSPQTSSFASFQLVKATSQQRKEEFWRVSLHISSTLSFSFWKKVGWGFEYKKRKGRGGERRWANVLCSACFLFVEKASAKFNLGWQLVMRQVRNEELQQS